MDTTRAKVYCAGPLFTEKEREEMAQLASRLEAEEFSTFLPQRDGLELSKCLEQLVAVGYDRGEAGHMLSEAIFALDVYQVLHECDVVVANLNGRVPDEGTVSEVAMAWARGKVVVGYKADSRSAFGGQDNPLVSGLFDFHLCQTFDQVVDAVATGVAHAQTHRKARAKRDEEISAHVKLGGAIWSVLQKDRDVRSVVDLVIRMRTEPARAD